MRFSQRGFHSLNPTQFIKQQRERILCIQIKAARSALAKFYHSGSVTMELKSQFSSFKCGSGISVMRMVMMMILGDKTRRNPENETTTRKKKEENNRASSSEQLSKRSGG